MKCFSYECLKLHCHSLQTPMYIFFKLNFSLNALNFPLHECLHLLDLSKTILKCMRNKKSNLIKKFINKL